MRLQSKNFMPTRCIILNLFTREAQAQFYEKRETSFSQLLLLCTVSFFKQEWQCRVRDLCPVPFDLTSLTHTCTQGELTRINIIYPTTIRGEWVLRGSFNCNLFFVHRKATVFEVSYCTSYKSLLRLPRLIHSSHPPINQSHRLFDAVFFVLVVHNYSNTCPFNIYIYINLRYTHSSHTFAHCYFYSVSSFFW